MILDLPGPVRLQGELRKFEDYRGTLLKEQTGSNEWLGRMARGEEPFRGEVPRSLALKVDSVGCLRPFAGDTVVLLLNAYEAFDEVVRLGYFLRPHVTLACFRPRVLALAEVDELALRCADPGPLPGLTVDLRDLAYQHFDDMDRYRTLFSVRDA